MAKAVPFNAYSAIPGVQRRRLAGNRFMVPYNKTSTNAGYTLGSRRYHRNGNLPLNNLRIVIPWCYFNPLTGESGIGNGATITAALEYPVGVTTRVPFQLNGNSSFTLADKQQLVSDPLSLSLPAGAIYGLHSFVNPGAGGFLVYGTPGLGAAQSELANFGAVNDGAEYLAGGTDKTITGTVANNVGNTSAWEPWMVGETDQWAPCILSVSDSTMIYTEIGSSGTLVSGSGDANGNVGWFQRMCGAAGIDYLCLSQGSTTAAMFTTPAAMLKRWSLLPMVTTAIICIGANDLYNGNGSTIVANINAFIASLKVAGIQRVYVTTLMPKTTSTDGWVTTANQTVNQLGVGTEQCRLNVNSAIRGLSLNGAGVVNGHAGVIDLEAFSGVARSGDGAIVWAPNTTADGVHMSTVRHIAFAATLNALNYI